MNKLRLIYAGTPEFAVPALYALQEAGHDICVVLTQPDRPAGRGQKLQSSPVKQAAQELEIEVWQPLSLRKADIKKRIRALNADAMVVAAYGLILPQSVLDIPKLGCINIHASLLPRWRGAAPIQRAIEAGDQESGITIMKMDAGLDTGDILSLHPVAIESGDTAQTLHDKLATLGAEAITATLTELGKGAIKPVPQNTDEVSYAHKLHKSEGEIDWRLSAKEIDRKIRAFNPWPSAYTFYKEKSLRIWSAKPLSLAPESAVPGQVVSCTAAGIDVQTGQGMLRIRELQLSGRKRLSVEQFVNAHNLTGQLLGTLQN